MKLDIHDLFFIGGLMLAGGKLAGAIPLAWSTILAITFLPVVALTALWAALCIVWLALAAVCVIVFGVIRVYEITRAA